jgi:hypothetical protein
MMMPISFASSFRLLRATIYSALAGFVLFSVVHYHLPELSLVERSWLHEA